MPTPGGPSNSTELDSSELTKSLHNSAAPLTARPTRHVKPITVPLLFLIIEIRCKVPSIPARLSPPTSPSKLTASSMSSMVIFELSASQTSNFFRLSFEYNGSAGPSGNLAKGTLPTSMTTSMSSSFLSCLCNCSRILDGNTRKSMFNSFSSVTKARFFFNPPPRLPLSGLVVFLSSCSFSVFVSIIFVRLAFISSGVFGICLLSRACKSASSNESDIKSSSVPFTSPSCSSSSSSSALFTPSSMLLLPLPL